MIIRLLNRIEVWLTLGLLALNLSFAIERYAPSNPVSEFVTGLLIGLSVAANIYAIWQLSVNASALKEKS